MSCQRKFIIISLLTLGGMFLVFQSALASSTVSSGVGNSQPTPTFDVNRLTQPPTVVPPAQADNGAQTYWGMCMSCHGDRGQGLTMEWRASFGEKENDCWQSGCHGSDAPKNSFAIPDSGVPALAGDGKLSRFTNAYELFTYIQKNMPYFRTGGLSSEDAWSLTAYLLRLNKRPLDDLVLSGINSSAIPVHHSINQAKSAIPGVLLLVGILILAAIGWSYKEQAAPSTRPSFFHHLHPPGIPAEQARFRYTLAAGGLAVFLSLVLLITGLLEMYYYVPTPEQAAVSIQNINLLVPFGKLVRNLHFWSAQMLVVVVTIHLLRVVLTGAYASKRRFNHLLGLGLLAVVLLLDFTGYILRWDKGIHWALVVGANLLKTIPWIGESFYQFVIGGSEPGAATLTRFYAWHIFGLSLIGIILMIWHIFRVRRDGGIAVSPSAPFTNRSRIKRFELLNREVLAMLITVVLLMLFSLFIPAPIKEPISDLGSLASDSRAPWFFLWVQQLLKFGDPFVLGVLTPVLVIAVLGAIPYVLPNARQDELGRWFPRGNRTAQVITTLIILFIFILTVLGMFAQ
jgi:quinol-cytochrome oxidoreductase complex cytochrome b subunit/mono/diheme cytochrome c family protein